MSKLPFIQHNAAGLHITGHAIRWIELSRIRDRVRVKRQDSEKIAGDFETALDNLLKRQEPSGLLVSVNVDPSLVLKKLVTVPDVDEEEILNAWVEKQYSLILEGRENTDSFLIRHTFLDSGDDHRKCFLAAIKKGEVDILETGLRGNGLKPVIVTTGMLETAYGLILSPEFVEGQAWIVRLFEDESFLGQYKGGLLQSFSPLDPEKMSSTDILDELDLIFNSGQNSGHKNNPDSVYLMASRELQEFTTISAIQPDRKPGLQLLPVDDHFNLSGDKTSADFSIAIGLAMKLLFQALDQINFLDEECLRNANREAEKRDCFHVAGVTGAFLLALFLFVMSVQWFVGSQLDQVQQTADQMEDKIVAIESATEMLFAERDQIKQVQNLIRNRSNLAPGLQKIGELTPGNVWFDEFTVQNATRSNHINVRGFSATETGVSKFIEMMEKESGIQNVVLRNAERTQSDRFYSQEEFRPQSLIRFEVQLEFENRN